MSALRTLSVIRAPLSFVLVLIAVTAWAQPNATSTTLSLSSNSVSAGTAVTLTATVTSTTPGTIMGLVLFCNASATYCEDSAIFGSVWMTTSGTATLRKTFGSGIYNVQAVFKGTNSYATSTSPAASVTVSSGQLLTTTTINATGTGTANYYNLSATVWAGGAAFPTGSVLFLDATTPSNNPLASVALSSGVQSGNGFVSTSGPSASSQNRAIAVGDFNNDGKLDYVVATLGYSSTATVMLGNGDGTFTAGATPLSAGSSPEGAVVADFNGDGNLDIAFANSAGNGVTVLLGDGTGNFAAPATSPAISFAASIAVGDFNGDGIPDLAVSNNASNSQVTILIGNGDGTFTVGPSTPVPQWSVTPEGIVAMDFNGDGKTDLAVTSADTYSPSNYMVTILLGNGDGTFTTGLTYTTGGADLSIAAGDFNGDGIPDLAIANKYDNTVTILLGNNNGQGQGTGTFTPAALPLPTTGDGPSGIVAGDFNNDGKLDLATANFNGNTVTILLGNGDGTFTVAPSVPATGGGPDGIAAGDFNGDGLLDIVTANYEVTTQSILLQSSSSTTVTASNVNIVPVTDSVYASYSGDTNYLVSQSGTIALSSIPQTPQTITFPNPGPLSYGVAPITLMATATSGYPVSYYLISGPGSLSGATLTITGAGSIVIEADQPGNSTYMPAPSVQITITVSGVTMTLPTSTPTVTAGQSATIPLAITPINGFKGSLSFTCTVPPAMVQASCSASSVQITGSAAVTAQVTVNTTAPPQASATIRQGPHNPISFGLLVAGVIVASGAGRKKLRRGKKFGSGILLSAIIIVMLAILVSCGGGGNSTKTDTGTPAGTYNLTLNATSGSATYTIALPVKVN